ncbi:MAG: non-ribosomal peptide synthetase [Legionella sp.]
MHGIAVDVVVLSGRKSVPKTTSGKIQRMLCKKKFLAGDLTIIKLNKQVYEPTRKELFTASEHINTESVAMRDNVSFLSPILNVDIHGLDCKKKLSDFGMTSIKLVELQSALTTITNREISIEYLLSDPSLKEIMSFLEVKIDPLQLLINKQVDLNHELNLYKNLPVGGQRLLVLRQNMCCLQEPQDF